MFLVLVGDGDVLSFLCHLYEASIASIFVKLVPEFWGCYVTQITISSQSAGPPSLSSHELYLS